MIVQSAMGAYLELVLVSLGVMGAVGAFVGLVLVSVEIVRSNTMRLGLRLVPAIGGGKIGKAALVM